MAVYIGELTKDAEVNNSHLIRGSARVICVPSINKFGGGVVRAGYNIDSSFFTISGGVGLSNCVYRSLFSGTYKELIEKAVFEFGDENRYLFYSKMVLSHKIEKVFL